MAGWNSLASEVEKELQRAEAEETKFGEARRRVTSTRMPASYAAAGDQRTRVKSPPIQPDPEVDVDEARIRAEQEAALARHFAKKGQ